jgi:hypothetical protein
MTSATCAARSCPCALEKIDLPSSVPSYVQGHVYILREGFHSRAISTDASPTPFELQI